MNCVQAKRDKFRTEIRREQLEQLYKLKRVLVIEDEYKHLHEQLERDIDRVAAQIANQPILMRKLINERHSLLGNLCATESNGTLKILINEYQIYRYLNLQGMSNLLYSDKELLKDVINYILKVDLLAVIIRQRQDIDESTTVSPDQKDQLIRLSAYILKLIKYYRLQSGLSKQRIIDLYTMAMNWFEINIEGNCLIIQIACDYVENLAEVCDLKLLKHIDQSPSRVLNTIYKLMQSSPSNTIWNFNLTQYLKIANNSVNGIALNILSLLEPQKQQVYVFQLLNLLRHSSDEAIFEKITYLIQNLEYDKQILAHILSEKWRQSSRQVADNLFQFAEKNKIPIE